MSLYKDASLVMIPSAYKDGKLYSIRPTDGSGDFTFSRGSNLAATRVDVNGLIEKGRENLLTYSNDLSNAVWRKTAGSVSGSKWTPNTANTYHPLGRSLTIQNGSVYAYSIELKADGYNFVLLNIPSGTGTNSGPIIDLTNGTLAGTYNGYNHNAIIESVEDGYYRVKMWFASTTTSLQVDINPLPTSSIAPYAGNGTNGILVRRIQLEAGLVATDYIETGASTAQAGILEDMPRLDYSGGASCPALLLEPQRTNAATHSEYFGAWNTSGTASVTDNQAVSPEGVLNAALLDFGSTTLGANRIDLEPSISAGTDYVFSVFVKNIDANRIGIRNYNSTKDAIANFDFSSASFTDTNINVIDTIVEPYDNNWYRIGIVFNSGVDTTADMRISPNTISGSDGEQIYIYGATLEAGSYPTSYIPTYGSSVTRSRDECDLNSMSEKGISTNNNWTILLDYKNFRSNQYATYFYALGGEIMHIYGSSVAYRNTSNVQQYVGDWTLSPYNDGETPFKIAFQYDGVNLTMFHNGAKKSSIANSNLNANFANNFNRLRIAWHQNNPRKSINQAAFYDTALTDSECIALTTL